MMPGIRPEQARDFCEQDEDPARIFALFDAADKGRTAPHDDHPRQEAELVPLRDPVRQMARDLQELRLRDRALRVLHHLTSAMASRTRAH
jgi:hypothetical protein